MKFHHRASSDIKRSGAPRISYLAKQFCSCLQYFLLKLNLYCRMFHEKKCYISNPKEMP